MLENWTSFSLKLLFMATAEIYQMIALFLETPKWIFLRPIYMKTFLMSENRRF